MGAPKTYTQADILDAIKGSGSIVSTVAKRLKCEWITAKRYIEKWESTKQAFSDESETILDLAESTLYTAIKAGDVQAAKWVLSTKGKTRGFTERHEVTGPEGTQLKIEVEYVGKSTAKDT